MMVTMEIIAVVESDDYGPVAILDPEFITIFHFDDFFMAATRCMYTDRPITSEISEEVANALMAKGVKCLNALVEDQL